MVNCSRVPGTVAIGPASHLVFSSHKLPTDKYATQAYSCMHPYLLCFAHCVYMRNSLSTHASTTNAFLLWTWPVHFLCVSAMYSHCKCSLVVHMYVHYTLISTMYTHFLYVYTCSRHVHIQCTFELSEDTCESTVCVYVL